MFTPTLFIQSTLNEECGTARLSDTRYGIPLYVFVAVGVVVALVKIF